MSKNNSFYEYMLFLSLCFTTVSIWFCLARWQDKTSRQVFVSCAFVRWAAIACFLPKKLLFDISLKSFLKCMCVLPVYRERHLCLRMSSEFVDCGLNDEKNYGLQCFFYGSDRKKTHTLPAIYQRCVREKFLSKLNAELHTIESARSCYCPRPVRSISAWGRIQRKLNVWDPMPELTITSPYVHSRVNSSTFNLGNPMPEWTLTLCQSRLYSPI